MPWFDSGVTACCLGLDVTPQFQTGPPAASTVPGAGTVTGTAHPCRMGSVASTQGGQEGDGARGCTGPAPVPYTVATCTGRGVTGLDLT